MLGPVTPREQGRLCSEDPGLAAASRELVERALADGLHGIEGWLDMGQVGDDVGELLCAVWRGDEVTGPLMAGGARAEVCKRLSRKLDDFLEEATLIQGRWIQAQFQANQGGKDFVQQAIDLSRGFPFAEAWQACEPLEEAIVAFVLRVAAAGLVGFSAEAAGNLRLLAVVVGDHMQQARAWRQSLCEVSGSQAALDARAICPSGAVGTVVALWPPRQVSTAPPGSACDQGF